MKSKSHYLEIAQFCATLAAAATPNDHAGDSPCQPCPSHSSAPPPTTTPTPQETREWLDALSAVIGAEGGERAHFLLEQLIDQARQAGIDVPFSANTGLRQHHPDRPGRAQPGQPRDRGAAARLHALERDGDGGQGQPPAPRRRRRPRRPHLELRLAGARCSAPASTTSGTPRRQGHGGDLLYIQGHSSPGIYARAYMEGRISEEQLLQLPPGGRRQGHLELSAPEADARVLAVPDRLDGPRAR